MRRFRRLNSVGQVWLAAALVLLANVPRSVCRCPNGQIKPVCLNLLSGGCCCEGDSCCAATAPRAVAAQRSCCGQRADHNGGALASNCCVKTPAPATTPVITPTTCADDATGTVVLSPASVVVPPAGLTEARSARLTHSPPIPPDLVTLLQHLLI